METKDLLAERGTTHGNFDANSSVAQELKHYMSMTVNWPKLTSAEAEALHMIAHKIGRILAGNPHFKDHWADIAGYAKLVADRCPE